MPTTIKNAVGLKSGDVLLVTRWLGPDRPPWRFFTIVTGAGTMMALTKRLVPSKNGRDTFTIAFADTTQAVAKLEPHEWPDGVHQRRMELLLKGEIEIKD